jgi:tetratricopeptide (TPR) repeat protein
MPGGEAIETRGNPTGWRKWLFRVAAVGFGPTVFFILVEFGLRVCGYGYPTTFFLRRPGVDGQPPVCIENVHFGRRFFPATLVRKPVTTILPVFKSNGSVRVFVLGESAAMGFPDPSSSFARILEVMLRDRLSATPVEVVNTATTAINSHAVLSIARECAALQPDFFVVHLGNNEVVGTFGAAGVLADYPGNLCLARANLYAKEYRTGQLLENLVESIKPARQVPTWKGMATFAESRVSVDDPRLKGTYSNFRQNLYDICSVAKRAGAKVMVCTIPVNLQNCPPFASVHRAVLSVEETAQWKTAYEDGTKLEKAGRLADACVCYEAAARIDDHFADLAFRQARCLAGLGKDAEARMQYIRARNLDALRFRADTTINEIVRDVVQQMSVDDVQLVDAERDFVAGSPNGVPGEEVFFEHVHMTFKGNYLLAASVFHGMAPMLPVPGRLDQQPLTEAQCAERLAYVEWNRWRAEATMGKLVADPPFNQRLDNAEEVKRWDARVLRHGQQSEAALSTQAAVYEKALATAPDDWMIRENYAQFLVNNNPAQAIEQYGIVLRQVPHHYVASVALGNLLLAVGETSAARSRFEAALHYDPEDWNAHRGLATAFLSEGKKEEAIAYIEARLDTQPDRADALAQFAGLLLTVNQPVAARQRLEEALQIQPDHAGAHLAMAQVCASEEDMKEAHAHLDAALQTRPSFLADVTRLRRQLCNEPGKHKADAPE